MKTCKSCGQPVADNAAHCRHCWSPLFADAVGSAPKDALWQVKTEPVDVAELRSEVERLRAEVADLSAKLECHACGNADWHDAESPTGHGGCVMCGDCVSIGGEVE